MPEIQLHNLEGAVVGNVSLPKSLEGPADEAILWQAVRMYLANKRQGNASTKTRGEIRGGGRKPWKQKHSGRARAGSSRSPLWRKGGVTFGPHPRDHRYELPKALRRRALVESLKVKVTEQAVLAVETLEGIQPKTKALYGFLEKVNADNSALVVVGESSAILARIARNIPKIQVLPASDLNCYDVLHHRRLVITSAGIKQLEGLVK